MMKEVLDYLYSLKFSSEAIGIQKDLLLAALIGVVSNLPKEVKSNFKQVVHIIIGTLLSTILTPMIMSIIGQIFHVTLRPESGYGIAALIGIIGINTIKKILLNKFSSISVNKRNEE